MLYRLLGNSPAMLEAWVGLAWPLRSKPTTSRALRELLIMQLAVLTKAGFEWQAHWPAAVKAGEAPDGCRDLLLKSVGGPEMPLVERAFQSRWYEVLARAELAAGRADSTSRRSPAVVFGA